ncbi:MAG: hypothetical protein A3J76_02665 [Candidatus Moranbacteria bacterium RBG_13_45_13]|nr:MAG: hypothetical protein A3J76_02665 [Candidatus Moranbacteria bacterium RBG_13_45_13]
MKSASSGNKEKNMKRYIGMILAILALCIAHSVNAEEKIPVGKLEKKFSFTGTLKFDLYLPKGKPAFTEQGLFLYAHRKVGDYGIGAGIDQWGGTDKIQSNHWTARPFVTVNWKQFYFVGGYQADTKHGNGHVFFGAWYVDKCGKLSVFFDPRYYRGVRNDASDFIDIFGFVKYAISPKYSLGIKGEYIGWFGKDRSHHWSMAGLIAERKFNNFTLGLEPAITLDTTAKCGTAPTFWFRTYFSF